MVLSILVKMKGAVDGFPGLKSEKKNSAEWQLRGPWLCIMAIGWQGSLRAQQRLFAMNF